MTSLQKCIAILFVALWVPLTAHCSLEKLPALSFLHCPSDTADNNCSDDACQTIESGLYKVSSNSAVIPMPPVCVVWATLVDLNETFSATVVAHSQFSYLPELPQRWQFVVRTALPVRAPSLLA